MHHRRGFGGALLGVGYVTRREVNIRGKPPIPPNSRKVYSLDFALQNRSRYAVSSNNCRASLTMSGVTSQASLLGSWASLMMYRKALMASHPP